MSAADRERIIRPSTLDAGPTVGQPKERIIVRPKTLDVQPVVLLPGGQPKKLDEVVGRLLDGIKLHMQAGAAVPRYVQLGPGLRDVLLRAGLGDLFEVQDGLDVVEVPKLLARYQALKRRGG